MDTEIAGTVIFQSPHPLVPLRFRDGEPRAVSWNGFSFPPDERGINWLPVEAVAEMTGSHGMVGVPDATAPTAKADARDAYIAELEASNERLRARVAELEAKQVQSTDGGAIRPTVFAAAGDHPMGGDQPALGAPPNKAEVEASQSATVKGRK